MNPQTPDPAQSVPTLCSRLCNVSLSCLFIIQDPVMVYALQEQLSIPHHLVWIVIMWVDSGQLVSISTRTTLMVLSIWKWNVTFMLLCCYSAQCTQLSTRATHRHSVSNRLKKRLPEIEKYSRRSRFLFNFSVGMMYNFHYTYYLFCRLLP